ncbi:hypothetical protein LCGC14_2796550, partial [marine sediment metagenome]
QNLTDAMVGISNFAGIRIVREL